MSELSADTHNLMPADGQSERIVRQAYYLATIIRCRIDRPETFNGFEERLRVLAPYTTGSSQERSLHLNGEVSADNRAALDLLYVTRSPHVGGYIAKEVRADTAKTVTYIHSVPVGEGFRVEERVDYEKTAQGLSALCFELFLVRPES